MNRSMIGIGELRDQILIFMITYLAMKILLFRQRGTAIYKKLFLLKTQELKRPKNFMKIKTIIEHSPPHIFVTEIQFPILLLSKIQFMNKMILLKV